MTPETYPASARTDLRSALIWLAVGALIVVGSWRMDRFEGQGATLHTMPGLWPGVVGLILATLAIGLLLRSLLRARRMGWTAADTSDAVLAPPQQFRLGVAMFFLYAVLLVGRGLPFWLGTALFVTSYIYVFRRADRLAIGTPGSDRGDALLAIACGVSTAVIVTLLFEQVFYVRLP